MTGRRHLLVVASQCLEQLKLRQLERAATELYEVLLDTTMGDCQPGVPDADSLLYGELTDDQIRNAVEKATDHAARHEATLVLAFLGHGFTPGNNPTLYLMAKDSTEENRDHAVNVRELLVNAVDRQGINGVIGIIDTCTAAAVLPSGADLATGTRGGKTRCQLLLAAGHGQEAYDLRLATSLVDLLRVGIERKGEVLTVFDVRHRLRQVVTGQNVASFGYDGDPNDPADLWLARNRQHRSTESAAVIGSQAITVLRDAFRPLGLEDGTQVQEVTDLQRLEDGLRSKPSSERQALALEVVTCLIVAARTKAFLRNEMRRSLNTATLRRAALAAGAMSSTGELDSGPGDLDNEADLVDHVALMTYPAGKNNRRQMARFVVALALAAGMDVEEPELRRKLDDWAGSIQATVHLNDAVNDLPARQHRQQLRLIVSLHASLTGDWPKELITSLLYDDEIYRRKDFHCSPNQSDVESDQSGVESALAEAVDWAEEHAGSLGLPLRHVDVAVPTRLLLRWRPEEVTHVKRLGVDYDVLTRWSKRINPDQSMKKLLRHAQKRLEEICSPTAEAPVDWLNENDITDLIALNDRLIEGRYTRALGIGIDPGRNEDLMELLLAHSPILLWPQTATGFAVDKRSYLDACWTRMPAELFAAYRLRWRGGESVNDIADLRAVWDDHDWLNYCRHFQQHPNYQTRSTS
jgi:hypothetical protein